MPFKPKPPKGIFTRGENSSDGDIRKQRSANDCSMCKLNGAEIMHCQVVFSGVYWPTGKK